MIKLHCCACPVDVEVRFSYSVSFGVFVKLPDSWQIKTDSQLVFCSLKCASEHYKKEIEGRRSVTA